MLHFWPAGTTWDLARYDIEKKAGMQTQKRGASSHSQKQAGSYLVGYIFHEWSANGGREGDSLNQIPDHHVMEKGERVVLHRKMLGEGQARYVPPSRRPEAIAATEAQAEIPMTDEMTEEERLQNVLENSVSSHMSSTRANDRRQYRDRPREPNVHPSHAQSCMPCCYMCGESGHLRRDCPSIYRIAIKPTGIPISELISVDPVQDDAFIGRSRLYMLDGIFYIHSKRVIK